MPQTIANILQLNHYEFTYYCQSIYFVCLLTVFTDKVHTIYMLWKKEHFSVYSCDYEALDISREIDRATSLFEM